MREMIKSNIEFLEKQIKYFESTGNKGDTYERLKEILKHLQELSSMICYLKKWNEQLQIDGVNSKGMVQNDIQYLLKKVGNE